MKKFLISIFIFFLIFFHKIIISKIIIVNISKWTEKEIFIENINIDYMNSEIVFDNFEIRNINKSYYKNIFEAGNIKIKYDFKSLFTNLIQIDDLYLSDTIFFLEVNNLKINNKINLKNTLKQNKEVISKINNKDQKSKIYPRKKVDKNFFISKATINNSKTLIKNKNKGQEFKIDLSNMSFIKVGNAKEVQHFKEVFKILLGDLLLRIRDQNLRDIIKNIYKL